MHSSTGPCVRVVNTTTQCLTGRNVILHKGLCESLAETATPGSTVYILNTKYNKCTIGSPSHCTVGIKCHKDYLIRGQDKTHNTCVVAKCLC